MKRLLLTLAVLVAAAGMTAPAALAVPPDSTTPCGVTTVAPAYTKWVVIVMENHSFSETTGHMPYLDSIRQKCGEATAMTAEARPSLPNYIAMTSGDISKDGGGNFTTDCLPSASCQTSRTSIFTQVSSWTFAQSMGATNCRLTNNGAYVVKHNPYAYFINDRATCNTDDVDLAAKLASKITNGNLRKFNLIIPDLQNDMHDGTIAQADAFLQTWLPQILDGPDYAAGNTAVVVTWDEPNTSAPLTTPIETVVISPSTPVDKNAGTAFNHYSLLKTIEQELGQAQLGNAATASSMRTAFNL